MFLSKAAKLMLFVSLRKNEKLRNFKSPEKKKREKKLHLAKVKFYKEVPFSCFISRNLEKLC